MRLYCVLLIGILLSFAGITTDAQTAAPLAAAKVAVFDTDALTDEKAGVARLVNTIKEVNGRFKKQTDDLNALRDQIVAAEKEANDNIGKWLAGTLAEKGELIDRLKRKYQYDAEDAKKAFEKAMETATGPVYKDINTALQAFAKQRGVDILIDASKFAGALMILNDAMDITEAFIKDYNAKNSGVPVK